MDAPDLSAHGHGAVERSFRDDEHLAEREAVERTDERVAGPGAVARPHPHAPDHPPAPTHAGPVAAAYDRPRDRLQRRPRT
ncbi:hypothetical protein ABZX30_04300 [Streptomyces sp. NPDC004542]|uniref:hypothetical protein n=1 Tax=Streptomyces sp. NPDC004542 TaxID=3154281 RepID=UPI0033A49E95